MFRFFENLIDPFAPYPLQDSPPNRIWPFVMQYARPFRGMFSWISAVSLVGAATEIWLIYYMGRLVDLLGDDPAQFWSAHGLELVVVALFILVIRPMLFAGWAFLMNQTLLPNFGTMIRWRAHSHVMRQPVGWFENDFAGRIANRITQTPPAAGEAMFQVFDAMTFAVGFFVGTGIVLVTGDVRLLLPLAIWFVGYLALVRWVVARVGPASQKASDARSEFTGRVVDSYTNIHSVKMFAHHDRELGYAREAIEYTRRTFFDEMRIYTVMEIVLVILNGLLIVGVVGWAMLLWAQGLASAGIVVAATALTLRISGMSGWIMGALTSFFRQMGIVAEGMETIAQPIGLLDAPGAPDLNLTEGRIEVQELSHHYGRDYGGLDRISLTIQPGEKIGLVGRSGAGKSTLVKLLLRFYDAESGRILIDGQDIVRVRQDSLRGHIGMVQQDSALLHRSVRDNILYGRPEASELEMIAAAKQAEAHDFILDLVDPKGRTGYDAHVGERGVKLSGGQRQRITLARVILKDAPILLLDEATSALDSEVEEAIQNTLYGMMEGKTVIAIAHRLSTIARMDRILVMDQGRIVEDGSHTELLALGGQYAGFWSRQSGGFLNMDASEEAAE